MAQASVLAASTGSGVLFEFPNAIIESSMDMPQLHNILRKRQTADPGQINLVTSFLMNGTADMTQTCLTQLFETFVSQ